MVCKFWLTPIVLSMNHGFAPHEANRIRPIIVYWRVEPGAWRRCLAAIHGLGLTIVETCVPWRVHEPAAGELRWDGERDLARFLEAAQAAGLAVVLRPGPQINAELTSFGMPDHVLGNPACQARTAHGTPVWLPAPPRAWPVPSYASTAFRARVHAWYAAVAEVVRPFLAPDGPVVAIGVDSEAQMFYRLGAYDHDYHPDALAAWREASGLDGEPPRAWQPDTAARCISWVRFKDQYVAHALGAFAHSLDDVGLGGIARFHNLPPSYHGLGDPRGVQRAIGGPVGIDADTARAGLRALRRRALASPASPIRCRSHSRSLVGAAGHKHLLPRQQALIDHDHPPEVHSIVSTMNFHCDAEKRDGA